MSEKRFTVDDDGIYDTQEKKHFKFIAYDWIDCDIYECCEKLNEQQATIEQLRQSQDVEEFSALFNQSIALQREIKDLKEENDQLKKQVKKLEIENEALQDSNDALAEDMFHRLEEVI